MNEQRGRLKLWAGTRLSVSTPSLPLEELRLHGIFSGSAPADGTPLTWKLRWRRQTRPTAGGWVGVGWGGVMTFCEMPFSVEEKGRQSADLDQMEIASLLLLRGGDVSGRGKDNLRERRSDVKRGESEPSSTADVTVEW